MGHTIGSPSSPLDEFCTRNPNNVLKPVDATNVNLVDPSSTNIVVVERKERTPEPEESPPPAITWIQKTEEEEKEALEKARRDLNDREVRILEYRLKVLRSKNQILSSKITDIKKEKKRVEYENQHLRTRLDKKDEFYHKLATDPQVGTQVIKQKQEFQKEEMKMIKEENDKIKIAYSGNPPFQMNVE